MNFEEQLVKEVVARMSEEQKWETFKALQKFDFDEMDRMFEEYDKKLRDIEQTLRNSEQILEKMKAEHNLRKV